jgi:deoxyribonuclease V
MKPKDSIRHRWDLKPKEAVQLQRELASKVRISGLRKKPKTVCGVDVASTSSGGKLIAAAVLMTYPGLEVIETAVSVGKANFPYVPGLLSFRECPVVISAVEKLSHRLDVMLVDGQGYAHPRRLGLASHLGLVLNCPTIGCAKSRLVGEHEEPDRERGSRVKLTDNDEIIGYVLRTRTDVKPLYISVGHKINLNRAANIVLGCCTKYRLPEPTRQAHILVTSLRRNTTI